MNDVKQKKLNAIIAQKILTASRTKTYTTGPVKAGVPVSVRNFTGPKKTPNS